MGRGKDERFREHRKKDTTFAGRLFSAQREVDSIRSILNGILEERLGLVFEDFSFDGGDDSLTITRVRTGVRLSEETQDKLYELGFLRIYLLHEEGWETYYYKGGDRAGFRKMRSR